uniref:Apoptosis resistant E3 ubiquitin protein ligase 1 n=1 Tax=Capra hircus TaxID=9925 RepID=A0A8C2PD55_CAPHI
MFYVIGGITVSVVAFFFTIKFLFELAARVVSFLQNEDRERRGDRTIYDYVRGNYLDPRSCKVSWDWKDPYEVGHSMAFRVHLFYKNGQPFPAHRPVGLRVHISHVELAVEIPVTQEVLQEPSSNVVKVAFTVRKAGRYEISVKLGGLNVAYSPYYKIFQPGMVVPSKTKIVCHFSTLVLTCGQPHTLQIVPRDEYDNPTNNSTSLRDEHNYSLSIHELGPPEEESTGVSFEKSVTSNRQTCQVFLRLTLHSRGCFHACISYQNQPINNGEFDIIVLSENERNIVERNVSTSGVSIYFEAYLSNSVLLQNTSLCTIHHLNIQPSFVLENGDEGNGKNLLIIHFIFCMLVLQQFSVKEFYLKIIPWRLYTFRVCPGTKFSYLGPDPVHKLLTLVVDDGIQPPVELSCKERNILAATFIRSLHKNIGGSETFQDKVNFFHRELRQVHMKRPHSKVTLKVSRHALLESSLKATRNFSISDWSKNFEVFEAEGQSNLCSTKRSRRAE